MLDLQTAVDGVGRLRVRHASGGVGILSGVAIAHRGPTLRLPNGGEVPIGPSRVMLAVLLDDGGRLEAPQTSFELAPLNTEEGHVCTCGDCEVAPFVDRCKYELAVREAITSLEREGSLGGDARRILESVIA